MNYFNFSETSSEPFYKSKKNIQSGGFFDFNNYSSLLFDAISQNNFNALIFLINNKAIDKINYTNNNNQTILHLLIEKLVTYENKELLINAIDSILNRTDILSLINLQDNNGNTVLHIAASERLDDICDKLIAKGADKSIKNNAGLYISSETDTSADLSLNNNETDKINNTDSVFISQKELNKNKDLSDKDKLYLNNMLNSINGNTKSTETSEAIGLTNISDTTALNNKNNKYSEYSNLIDTSQFIDEFVSTKEKLKQDGGKKKKIKKSRKLNTNSLYKLESSMEMPKISQTSAVNIDSSTEELNNSSSSINEMSELSRMINNQATEIHERSVKKIMELLNINEQEARTIKAYLYNEVKTQHPELNNFDRAVEMEKRITKDYLNKIDNKKIKQISDIISEKQKIKSDSEKKSPEIKTKKSKKTKTSDDLTSSS